jgi:hypothetical protein
MTLKGSMIKMKHIRTDALVAFLCSTTDWLDCINADLMIKGSQARYKSLLGEADCPQKLNQSVTPR